ncbi:MAG: FecR family protein, partial [Planctomycetota bacterium]
MSTDERFIALWNDYLEGELDASGIAELQALVAGDDRLIQMAADSYQMHRLLGLIAQDGASRRDDFVNETLARLPADNDQFVDAVMQHLPHAASRKGGAARRLVKKWPLAAAALVALIAGLYFLPLIVERPIARVTGLNGSLQWTGDGGRVFYDLSVGTELPGGTVEGMAPGSWFELEFIDGSVVTISGHSTLTFSDHGQKKLYLKEGHVSGNVKPQPAGRPMLIYT